MVGQVNGAPRIVRAIGLADVASAGSVHEGTVSLRAAAVETKASQVMGMDVPERTAADGRQILGTLWRDRR